MVKVGTRRPDPYDPKNHGMEDHQNMHHLENKQVQVPGIQGAAKNENIKVGPINTPNWVREDYKTGN